MINTLLPNHQQFRSSTFARGSDGTVLPEPTWWQALQEHSYSPIYMGRVVYVVMLHFVLSLHNGWIDPRLRIYA
jgi:hypothetical protein